MIPLIYLVGAGIAGLLFTSTKGFGLWSDSKSSDKNTKTKSIAVLGQKGSGKSTLQAYFRGFTHDGLPTHFSGEKVGKAVVSSKGKTIILSKGIDVSGEKEAIKELYEDEIQNCDLMLFVFDSNQFLNEAYSQKECIALLDFINRKNIANKLIILIGSHVDKLLKGQDTKANRIQRTKQITNILSPYLVKKHVSEVMLVNLLNNEELEAIKKGMFN